MFVRSDYIIEISKLAKGSNELEISVNKTLFEEFGCGDVLNLDVKVKINAFKSERMIEIGFVFNGGMDVECSRCLAPVTITVNKKTDLYIKFGEKNEEVDINEWIVDENNNEIDLANYIYGELRTEIPIAPVHKHRADCNADMLKKLSDINNEGKSDGSETDPRWEKLKELL